MSDLFTSPVPYNQRPEIEYTLLSKSWFFSIPRKSELALQNTLLISWAAIMPLFSIICSGSIVLREDMPRLILTVVSTSLLFPLLILTRQLLGWRYIYNRLNSEKIIYEESGWYDGQTWEKPIYWKERDLLIASYDVLPILNKIVFVYKKAILLSLLLLTLYLI